MKLIAFTFTILFTLPSFAAQKQPNILWFVSEDNIPMVGCYGDPYAKTPNIDKLASQGVMYKLAFANAPVCAPSRSTLITGMYASSTGTLNMRSRYPLPADFKFYPDYLKAAGYYVMNPGKTDYNIQGADKSHWDKGKSWTDAPKGKPWMLVLNSNATHESCLHGSKVHEEYLKEPVDIPAYHPDTPEIRSNWVEYYHKMTKMDGELGELLDKLDKAGLADDTIVFYYSDHGGILPRSKRFLYDSGLHVPFVIRFGKNVQQYAPAPVGSKLDRMISFVDIAPSLLSMAGAAIPPQMQGEPFLGPKATEPRQYVFGFRERMDERIDLSYTIRDKQYRYTRHFMPHRIFGQHLDYLWKMPAMASWEKEFLAGRCNEVQSRFFREKPVEELWDETTDRWEVNNLANDPAHKADLDRLRAALRAELIKNRDAAFLPESEMPARAKGDAIYTMTHDPARYPFEHILEVAEVASQRDAESLPKLIAWMTDPDAAVRYWAATGCCVRGQSAAPAAAPLTTLLKDPSSATRIAAAEALCRIGQPQQGLDALVDELSAKDADLLRALNALDSLGNIVKPRVNDIEAKMKAANTRKDIVEINGGGGEKYSERATQDLLAKLRS